MRSFLSVSEIPMYRVGTDAVETLVNYCFRHLNFHKIYLHVFESDIMAIKCYENAGFTVEGELKDHHFSNGKYENVLILSKIRTF